MTSNQQLPSFQAPSFEYTNSPNPGFTYGQKVDSTPEGKAWVEGEKDGWTDIDTATVEPARLYPLMTSAIAPRPVAFVSTISESGTENLALFSWFNTVTSNPPTISISVSGLTGRKTSKDTARNIKATKEFTANIISIPWIDNANVASIDAPPDVSEWPITGLTKKPSITVKPAVVKESAFSMECELYQAIDIADPKTAVVTTTLILGHVKYIHIRNDMLTERGTVDPDKLKPIARMGDILYGVLGGGFRLRRPAWENEKEKLKTLVDEETLEHADKL
ncbi:hypothetical protein K474DRAFT_1627341 [Panus rudis PR-1116 ss-1]|nr:hypothetical protein K474DRAFT_1627341 [Panus rudis PR-1116 ss-1]